MQTCIELLRQLICHRSAIGASSQTISEVSRSSWACGDCFEMFDRLSLCRCGLSGILNLECAVRPPCSRSAATPDDATARAILPEMYNCHHETENLKYI